MLNSAHALVTLKTSMGKSVPDYAKKLAAQYSSNKRSDRELRSLLDNTSKKMRESLFAQYPYLKDWYEAESATQ